MTSMRVIVAAARKLLAPFGGIRRALARPAEQGENSKTLLLCAIATRAVMDGHPLVFINPKGSGG